MNSSERRIGLTATCFPREIQIYRRGHNRSDYGPYTETRFNMAKKTYLFQFRFRHSTNTVCPKVCVPCLYASQATKIFVTLFLPFGNQVFVCNILFQAIFVKFYKTTGRDTITLCYSLWFSQYIFDITRTAAVGQINLPLLIAFRL